MFVSVWQWLCRLPAPGSGFVWVSAVSPGFLVQSVSHCKFTLIYCWRVLCELYHWGLNVCCRVSDWADAGAAGCVWNRSDGSSGLEAALPAAAAALQQRAGAAEEDLPETERQTAHWTQPATSTNTCFIIFIINNVLRILLPNIFLPT